MQPKEMQTASFPQARIRMHHLPWLEVINCIVTAALVELSCRYMYKSMYVCFICTQYMYIDVKRMIAGQNYCLLAVCRLCTYSLARRWRRLSFFASPTWCSPFNITRRQISTFHQTRIVRIAPKLITS